MLPPNLPTLLREAGLEVTEIKGWQTRGRPGSFAPVGVLNHHTAASARLWALTKMIAYAVWMAVTGRSDLPAPLTQLALAPTGRVFILAAGRANHAGTARASGSVGAGDGNTLYIGIEWMLSGYEAIPDVMLDAGARLNAVLTEKVTKTSVLTVSCHYNTSITGKWDIGDPEGVNYNGHKVLNLSKFRLDVDAERRDLYSPKTERPVMHDTLNVAAINIPAKVGKNSWEKCFNLTAQDADVFGVNECFTAEQRAVYAARRKALGFQVYGMGQSSNPVFWGKDRYRLKRGKVHTLHEAATGALARKYPGYNAKRTLTEAILKPVEVGSEPDLVILNAHLVPEGVKVNPVWRAKMRVKSQQEIRRIAQKHHRKGRRVVVLGDMNTKVAFALGNGVRWIKKVGIDKIATNGRGKFTTYKAPTDHKRGIRATLKF